MADNGLSLPLRRAIATAARECRRAGWDGYGASAVDRRRIRAARRFVAMFPNDIPEPEIGADPDGCISFEWRAGPRCTVLVSAREGAVDYAGLFGGEREHGSLPISDCFPQPLATLIRRVQQTE